MLNSCETIHANPFRRTFEAMTGAQAQHNLERLKSWAVREEPWSLVFAQCRHLDHLRRWSWLGPVP